MKAWSTKRNTNTADDTGGDLESGQAAPPAAPPGVGGGATSDGRRRKRKGVTLVALLASAVALAICLGVTLGGSDKRNEKQGAVAAASTDFEVEDRGATDTTSTIPESVADVFVPEPAGTVSITAVPAPAETDNDIIAEKPSLEEEIVSRDTAVDSKSNDFFEWDLGIAYSKSNERPEAYKAQYLESNGPIATKVRTIDPTVANGYSSCDDLRDDLENALKYYANTIIARESKNNEVYARCDPNNPNWWYDMAYGEDGSLVPTFGSTPTVGFSMTMPPVSSPAADDNTATDQGEDSFETNNQVEGVDEADIAKSDGVNVYAAYGDILYAWNATDGTQGVSITKMLSTPGAANLPDYCTSYSGQPTWYPTSSNPPTHSSHPTHSPTFSHSPAYSSPPTSPPPPTHAPSSRQPTYWPSSLPPTSHSTLFPTDPRSPTSSPSPTFLRTPFPTDDTCRIGRRAQRSRERRDLSHYSAWCDRYKPNILSLLLGGDRLTVIVSEKDDEPGRIISDRTRLTIRVYDTSIVPTDGRPLKLLGETQLKGQNYNSARSVGTTGFVITTSHINQYLVADDLYRHHSRYCGLNSSDYKALASQVALNATAPFVEQMAEELQLRMDDDTCGGIFQVRAFQSGDEIRDATDGDVIRQFVQVRSFDMGSNSLRGDVSADAAPAEIVTRVAGAFSSGYLDYVYASQDLVTTQNVGSSYNSATGSWDESTFILGFDMSGARPKPFSYAEVRGSPLNQYSTDYYDGHLRVVTTEWQQGWTTDETGEEAWFSRTTNKIFVLKVPDPTEGQEMKLVGESEHLGKPNESVYAVRFIGDKAYIVTFERIDPFIIYDLSDPTKPTKLGELEIPGFSSYLHPIDMDGTPMMLGLGEHIDPQTQCREGVKISLFDISDLTNPTERATFIDKGAYSSVGYDFKSFRFMPISKKLIFPKSEYTWTADGNFDGFAVYDVNATAITPSYEIQHASSYAMYYGCWYSARMPPRSFVFKSKLTTVLSHSVISTDLDDGNELWGLNLDKGLDKNDCSPYF